MKQSKKMKRDVKRRLMLTKRNNFSSSAVKTLNMNKRVTAFFVAFAMILSMLPMGIFLHTRAGEMDQLDPVAMLVRMNGVDNWDEVTVDAGKISDNIGKVQVDNMPDGAEFVKAVMIDHDTGIETEIQSLGAIGDDYYYSLNDDTNVGTLLDKTHEELILIYGNRYRITVQQSGEGAGTYEVVAHEDDAGKYVWAKEDIVIKAIEPGMDCKIDGIQYRSGTSNGTASIKNGIATVPYNKIKGDVTLTLDFEQITSYSITEGDVAQGDICQNMNSSSTKTDRQNVDPVTPGNTATFLVFSQSWTGDDVWVLNQLTLNGEDLNLPSTEGIKAMNNGTTNTNGIDGYSATTTLDNGSEVTVKLIAKGVSLPWKKDDVRGLTGYLDKKRCVYEVTITNVHEDYVVDGNFKEADSREVIIKGLRGIEKTGAAKEELYTGTGNSWDVAPRYYTLVQNDDNIYTANYTNFLFSEGTYPSDNLILYTVKTGYNPYSVTTKMKYGNTGEAVNVRAVSVDGTEAIPGKPVDVIRNASVADGTDYTTGRFDTSFRHWGYNSPQVLENNDTTYSPGILFGNSILGTNKNLLLTDVHEDTENDWYAVALPQNAAMDQQLFLNASPYEFKLQLNAQGNLGSSASVNFANSENRFAGEVSALRETESHSVVSANPYGTLPKDEPTSTGYAFEYWVLTDDAGNILELPNSGEMQYQPLDRINLTEELIDAVVAVNDETDSDKLSNEKTIYLSAVWKEVQESSKTKVEINAYHQSASGTEAGNGKTYARHYGPVQETQNVGSVALLNLHQPDRAEYYVLNADLSVLKTDAKKQTSSDVIPDDNYLNVYYDYKTVTLDLQKVVKGKPKSTEYTITLTLTKPAGSPVSVSEALAMMDLTTSSTGVTTTEDTITISKKYGKDSKITFDNVPYNWSYHVLEDVTTDESDYTSTDYDQSGQLTDNTKLIVTNTGNNPGIEVDKKLNYDEENDTYSIDVAAYATGESYTEQLSSNVPLDIAVVLDQSGSMAYTDVYTYSRDNNYLWTVSSAADGNHYYKDPQKANAYYKVISYTSYGYQELYQRGDYMPMDWTNGMFNWFGTDNENPYYIKDNSGKYRNIDYRQVGYTLGFSAHDSSDPRYVGKAGYHIYLTYKDDNNMSQPIYDYYGYEESDYRSALPEKIVYRFGQTIYEKKKTYGLGYYDDNGILVKLTEGVESFSNTETISFRNPTNGTLNQEQPLFQRTAITRAEALKQAVNGFVEEVAKQSKDNNVDHKIAVIGFAGNEVPAYSGGTGYNYSGDNREWDYVNTGLYIPNYSGKDNEGNDVGFKNYQTITGYTQTSEHYTNAHYYLKYSDGYYPYIYHKATNNSYYYWWDVADSFNTNSHTYNYYTDSQFADLTHYKANYENLSGSDYRNALISASVGNQINPQLTTAIDSYKAWGGTYISYGLAMANKLFENNPISEGEERKRIIIVFTDGQPGSGLNGFEDAIADEAIIDGAVAKNTYGASIYTVGLYPENATDSSSLNKTKIETFLHNLSSNSYTSTTNVYTPELDGNKTYYYYDGSKTYSVSRDSNYSKSWIYFVGNNILTASGSDYLYDADNNAIRASSADTSKMYRIQYNGNYYPIYYDYRWRDSDGYVVGSKFDESDTNGNHYQFFEIGAPTTTDDNINYVLSAKSTEELEEFFNTISHNIQHPTTTVQLDAYSSFIKDGISENFDYSKATASVKTYDASHGVLGTTGFITTVKDANSPLPESETSADGAIANFDTNTGYLTVNGFDYSKHYIAENHAGKVLVATIDGLKLKEGVYGDHLVSNTTDSGVYKKDGDTDKLVAEFPQQETSASTYTANVTLKYVGENRVDGQKFNVTLKLTKSDGTPYVGTFGDITFSSTGEFSTKMADGSSKHLTTIPKDAILTVTVADPDNTDTYYTYVVTDSLVDENGDYMYEADGTTKKTGSISTTEDPRVGVVSGIDRDHPDILISVTDNRQLLRVTNHNVGHPGEDDFADRTKQFPIQLKLYKGETAVTGDITFLDQYGNNVTFTDGTYETELADSESIVLFVPKGYSVEASDKSNPFNYTTTYSLDADTAQGDPVTAVFNDDSAENGHAIDIYHTIDSIVISGIIDGLKSPSTWLIIVATGLSLGAAGWLGVRYKRKKEEALEAYTNSM